MKLGAEGCYIGHGETLLRVPGLAVQARDSTGAGDSFGAGIIAGFLGGLDWHSAAVLGNAMGAVACTRAGAGVEQPLAGTALSLLLAQGDEAGHRQNRAAIARATEHVRRLAANSVEEGDTWPS
jgi:sugar/nucleoside kinase (ribokinase family)